MVSSGYQGWSPWRTCICETVDRLLHCVVSPAFSFFDFDPFLFFELFNLEWAKFSQLWFCTVNNSWPSINFHASFFPSMKIHGLWQAINSHCDTLAVSKIVETKYPVFVTYQVCVVKQWQEDISCEWICQSTSCETHHSHLSGIPSKIGLTIGTIISPAKIQRLVRTG